MKISAVMIALVLWFFVTSSGQSELSLDVPVEFRNMPKGFEMVSSSARTVAVTVRGQERLMKNIRPSDMRVTIDLERAKKGEAAFPIAKDDIKIPYSMKVVTVQPASLKVRLDETAKNTVPIQLVITGQPEQGYSVSSVSLDPKSILIYGLKNEVKRVREVKTEPLDISGLDRDLAEEVALDLSGTNLKVDRDKVQVRITVARKKR